MDHVTLAHVEKMMKLLDKGFDPNFQDEHSGSELLCAMYYFMEKKFLIFMSFMIMQRHH